LTDNNTRIVFGSLQASVGEGKSVRGLFSYPLTDIPSGSTINSVEFHVVQLEYDSPASENGPVPVELRAVSQSFSEGTNVMGSGGSNWNNTFGATMTLGGAVLTSAMLDADPGSPVPATPIDTTFASSAGFVAAVQTQLSAGQPFNFALVLPPSYETSSVRRIFRTTSNSDLTAAMANRPRLIIDYTAPLGVPGDYNGDNKVDAADYTIWRKNLGGDASAFAAGSRDPTLSGVVASGDYAFWRTKFGTPAGSGASLNLGAVPEPCALALLVMGLTLCSSASRRGR
jgi:hypothetical protein